MPVVVYRIHPAVGIARVGDSDDHYLAPEKLSDLHENPKEYSQPPQSGRVYRDNTGVPGKILRQAARFRIFEFTYWLPTDTVPGRVKEVTSAEWDIQWTVELANKKSFPVGSLRSAGRILDAATSGTLKPGETGPVKVDRKVSLQGSPEKNVTLARLHGDDSGRLIVVPGSGQTGHVYANELDARSQLQQFSPGWWDDLGDGPVTAKIRRKNTTDEIEPVGAWVVLAAPAYSGPVRHVITLYDALFALHFEELGSLPFWRSSPRHFSFRDDIHPVLHRASLTSWVSDEARRVHGPGQRQDYTDAGLLVRLGSLITDPFGQSQRWMILHRVKLPQGQSQPQTQSKPRILSMPPIGMQQATSFQKRAFEAWANDPERVAFDWNPQPRPTAPISEPAEMTRCHLSLASGGPFIPGAEVGGGAVNAPTWPLVKAQGMETKGWDDAFRVDPTKPAGTLTFEAPVPWQVDLFLLCFRTDPPFFPFGAQPIWPGLRPLEVVDSSNTIRTWRRPPPPPPDNVDAIDAVLRWNDFGFLRKVVSAGTVRYVEDERKAPYT